MRNHRYTKDKITHWAKLSIKSKNEISELMQGNEFRPEPT
jgi:hypothetical protein